MNGSLLVGLAVWGQKQKQERAGHSKTDSGEEMPDPMITGLSWPFRRAVIILESQASNTESYVSLPSCSSSVFRQLDGKICAIPYFSYIKNLLSVPQKVDAIHLLLVKCAFSSL